VLKKTVLFLSIFFLFNHILEKERIDKKKKNKTCEELKKLLDTVLW